jgi:hypothetical protein
MPDSSRLAVTKGWNGIFTAVLHPGAQPAAAYHLRQLRLRTAAPWVYHMSASPGFFFKTSCHEVHANGTRKNTGTAVLPWFFSFLHRLMPKNC